LAAALGQHRDTTGGGDGRKVVRNREHRAVHRYQEDDDLLPCHAEIAADVLALNLGVDRNPGYVTDAGR
jgi:hypothetical protein